MPETTLPPACNITDAVRSFAVDTGGNPFDELLAAVRWEDVGKGRRGAVLVQIDEAGGVPIVRTTTRYGTPAQPFRTIHDRLAEQIQTRAALPFAFNNALAETYTNAYRSMAGHSDQALDLAAGSSIAVFSCYQHPEIASPPRKLVVEPKEAGGDVIEIPLTHNSAVVFSVDTNRLFRHKIVLDAPPRTPDNTWLGITFRTSRTFVRYHNSDVYFPDDTRLTLAGDDQRGEYYRLRRRENMETDFVYPPIRYTISNSDLIPPAGS